MSELIDHEQHGQLVLAEEIEQEHVHEQEREHEQEQHEQEQEEEPAPTATRGRKKKSLVWQHFTVVNGPSRMKRACCNLCKQTFAYSDGSKVAGTSHLKRHITLGSCPMLKATDRDHQYQLTPDSSVQTPEERPAKRRYRVSGFSGATFDPNLSLSNLAKMVILHDYPLHVVEQPAFLAFVESLQPKFQVHDATSVEAEVLTLYHKEKHNLMHVFGSIPGRISLAISLWTTSQTLGYVALHGQFIDSDWKLHRRMLNFLMVTSPHSENALSEAIDVSLSDWNLKSKLFTITLDNNCSSHDIYSANLQDHLSNKDALLLKGQLFVVRCYAHVLNAVAQDVIASIHGIIYNIRESVKFIKASPSREEKFAEIALQLEIPSTKTLSLDTTTQWNTTYSMLCAALEYKQAFNLLETCDDNYNEAPSTEDWRKVDVACVFLKLLYDSANTVNSTEEPTSNLFYHEAWKIQLELKGSVQSTDPVVSSIANEMYDRFEKYWRDCSLILAIAVVMDPRYKMKLVDFSFKRIYGNEESPRYVKAVEDALLELYNEYVTQPLPLTPAYVEQQQQEVAPDAIEPIEASINNTENNTYVSNAKNEVEEHTNGGDQSREAEANVDVKMSEAEIEANNNVTIQTEDIEVNNNVTIQTEEESNERIDIQPATPISSTGDGLMDFDIYLSEMAVNQPKKPELEQYLEEMLQPRTNDFNILTWWKMNSFKYPTLSKLARDILSIPMAMAGGGTGLSVFSAGGANRVLDEYRSSMRPDTLEAIFCAKDWLQYMPTTVVEPTTPGPMALVKMEM
ncbi:zinc finger BED domain-containing protein RICESLEEPER 1-like [Carex rostrata]